MEFKGGATASFTMNAFNCGGRYIRIFGTKGELFAHASDNEITLFSLTDRVLKSIPIAAADESINAGHGGDQGIVGELYDYLNGDYKGFCAADIEISVKNHLIGFAAEKARHCQTVEDVDAFYNLYGMRNY